MAVGRANRTRKKERDHDVKMRRSISNFATIILFLIFVSIFYLVVSFTPLTKKEQIEKYNKMSEDVEPFSQLAGKTLFCSQINGNCGICPEIGANAPIIINYFKNSSPFDRKNLSECARQVRANMVDVENFLKRIPQSSMEGKCFVACILKRNAIIRGNKIDQRNLLEANRAVYGEDSEVMARLKSAIVECNVIVEGIFEICEYATVFNDCMHMKMEHLLDKVTMERRMEALGQMTSHPDEWNDEDDELLKLVKDEL